MSKKPSHMSHITTKTLSELTGFTKRHCQRLLSNGEVPCAVRTSGGHWDIPDNAKVRAWIKTQKGAKHSRKPHVYSAPVMPSVYSTKKVYSSGDGDVSKVDGLTAIHRCQKNLKNATREMQNAIAAARENAHAAGLFLMDARKQFPDANTWRLWLKANKIQVDEAKDMMNFAKWVERGTQYTDALMLKRFGIIKAVDPTNPHANKQAERNKSFVVWVSKSKAFLHELAKRRPIEQWTRAERDSVAWQIKPLAEMYDELTN
jgi:hypothetical protein